MATLIHVLCSTFTKIVRREMPEVGKTMRCWRDKNPENAFFRRHFAAVWRRAPNVCRWACHVTPRLPVKFRPNRFLFARVSPEKVISAYKNSDSNNDLGAVKYACADNERSW